MKKNQLDFQNKDYAVNINAFVCHGPAQQLLKSIKSYNAYYGCERCLVHGRWEGRVVFDEINCNLLTSQSVINQEYHDHQIDKTPLIDSGVGSIMQFPLDYTHLVCLGVMKRLLLFCSKTIQVGTISDQPNLRKIKKYSRINAL